MPEAIGTYRKAADKGSTSAMVELGVHYGTGVGVAKDEAQARKLFQRAADAGNPRGVSNLAAIGGGSPLDSVKARALLSKGAEANSAAAEYQLGVMMADGLGGPKDDVAARALFEKAAAQDYPGALERMGAFARDGRGGPQGATLLPQRIVQEGHHLGEGHLRPAHGVGQELGEAAVHLAQPSHHDADALGRHGIPVTQPPGANPPDFLVGVVQSRLQAREDGLRFVFQRRQAAAGAAPRLAHAKAKPPGSASRFATG